MSLAQAPTRCVLLGLLATTLLLTPAAARASVTIQSFQAQPSSSQAGAHPDFGISLTVTNRQDESGPCACDDTKEVATHLPTGFIGNPHAAPQCTTAAFAADLCPVDSQVGVVEVLIQNATGSNPIFVTPLFNLVPPPGEAGLLGFKSGLFDTPTFEVISARTDSDYGLDVDVTSINHLFPLARFKQIVWGVPADPVHDGLRFGFGEEVNFVVGGVGEYLCDAEGKPSSEDPVTAVQMCAGLPLSSKVPHPVGEGGIFGGPGHAVSSSSPETPFTQNPTTCGETSLTTSIDVTAYDNGVSHAELPWPATIDCDQLSFNPSLFARPTTEETDTPSGIDVDLKAPQFESREVPSPSEIKDTVVTLPPGFSINPSAADGKASCTDAEARFGTTEEAHCPEFAKIGTLEVRSPVLPGVLPGAVYIGQPQPGERYRLFIAFNGFGIHVKLPGTVHPDPSTGQVVTQFLDLPQFPFEDFDLHFFGSERGVLATPTQCGTYPVNTEFVPWDAALATQTSTQFFDLDSGPGGAPCPNGPRPFDPRLQAASATNIAGSHTSFSLRLNREDGEQDLTGLTVSTPPGFAATLRGVAYCPQAAIEAAAAASRTGLEELAAPSCPADSLVGEATAGVGAGAHPYYAPGRVYLAGPYKGAPLSLVVITPAVSGPYDLGDVVVRAALWVNPETVQVTAVSDPLPQILAGIPLRLRSVLVNLNRPGFVLNPTDCDPFAVSATLTGSEAATATDAAPFQVANCARLPFKPKLSIKLKGSTKHAGHPALTAVVTYPPSGGYANIAAAQVNLPPSEFIDQGNLNKTCTKPVLLEGKCPASAVYGKATAWTPLLEKPLSGNVYLVGGYGYKLPALVAELNGQIRVLLVGKVDSGKNKGIRSTFETVPDAPVEKFVLEMKGGKRYSLLENSESLCAKPHRASARFIAQSGKTDVLQPLIATRCSKSKAKRKLLRDRHAAGVR